jgi:hypothetical protein
MPLLLSLIPLLRKVNSAISPKRQAKTEAALSENAILFERSRTKAISTALSKCNIRCFSNYFQGMNTPLID